ncbi:hypothetical protein [Jannaschia sp. M317]|uniref:hypothetical protein n=1 Tax=Jannaschia sp. M317 TaxID=2867011 RepID=UPI0021A6464C|nr:hypothetical protein [Jannaschia sp. M317]UWQ19029.1 hypothetical protein K3551_07080 [Jannaschia sp. M317]
MSLILPVLFLAALAWIVPWGLGRVLPEGLGWLIVNGMISVVALAVGAGALFVLLYGSAGGVVWQEAPWHFVSLSARSAIVWGPVLVLSLANLPRGWREVEW